MDDAADEALPYLSVSQSHADRQAGNYHLASSYTLLCQVAHRRGDWHALSEWAANGEAAARRQNGPRILATYLAWQAVAARHLGDEEVARRSYRAATSLAARLGSTPGRAYFDALSHYHETHGELDRALKVRSRQLRTLAGKGQITNQCRCYLERCRLLGQLGRSMDSDLAAGRKLALELAEPERFLAAFEEIERGV